MPYVVKNIIHYRDFGNHYHRLHFESKTLQRIDFNVGVFGSLIPSGVKLKYNDELDVEVPLFNKAKNSKIIEEIGQQGLLYLELQKGYLLNEIIVEPDSVSVDIYYGNETLVYGFYNVGANKVIALTLSIVEDTHNAYSKIKAHSIDLEWRQYFVRQALLNPGVKKIQVSDPIIRELMTQVQLADYMQVSKKTIQNWTSEGKIPSCHLGGTVRYRKSEIDKELNKR